ncbi:MAG: glycosyltransferase [Blastocatellia bacterium]|nr:glycosyltransferase [Blastocatellia bacterium]
MQKHFDLMNRPKVSIIIASYNSKSTIEKCLQALLAQKEEETFEIIVVDSSDDATSELVSNKYPEVRLYTFSERKFPGDARNFGISKAMGSIVAFTDTDCVPHPNWIKELVNAQKQYPLIGGSVDIANPAKLISWASYFCEFSQWIPNSKNRFIEMPGCCLAIDKAFFEKFGPFIEGTYCSDTAFHWKANQSGYYPFFVNSMRVSHLNIDKFTKFVKKQFSHGKQFARVRVKEKNFTILQRIIYVLGSPLIPLLLFFRNSQRVCKAQRYIKEFVKASPFTLLGLTLWSLGEAVGYIAGAKK